MPETIVLPRRTLVVLCGLAGSGKSTFAARWFLPTQIVSSDGCRELVADDPGDQQVNRDAFELFHFLIGKRLAHGRLTVADSTALEAFARQELLRLASLAGYQTCLLVVRVSVEVCLERNRQRERRVPETVIQAQQQLLEAAELAIPLEGWDQIHVVDEQQMDSLLIQIPEELSDVE